jgi:hypothetical protein
VNREVLRYGPAQVPPANGVAATVAFVAGGLFLVWSSYIHFHLWDGVGYRHIPTIGPLFLAQSITGLVLGALVIAIRRVWMSIVAAGFAASTLAGFLISVEHGLFGFKDAWSAPFAHEAFLVEIVAVVLLMISVVLCLIRSTPPMRVSSSASWSSAAR